MPTNSSIALANVVHDIGNAEISTLNGHGLMARETVEISGRYTRRSALSMYELAVGRILDDTAKLWFGQPAVCDV